MPFEVTGGIPFQLQERGLQVPGVQLAQPPGVRGALVGNPYAVVQCAPADGIQRLEAVFLRNHHVTPVASAPIEVAPARGPRANWRHHFEEVAPDRHQGVLEAELPDARIDVARPDAEDPGEIPDGGLELPGNQADLSQMNGHGVLP